MNKTVINFITHTHADSVSIENVHGSISRVFSEAGVKVIDLVLCDEEFWQMSIGYGINWDLVKKKKRQYKFGLWRNKSRVQELFSGWDPDLVICDGVMTADFIMQTGIDQLVPTSVLVCHGFIRVNKSRKRLFKKSVSQGNWKFVSISKPVNDFLRDGNIGVKITGENSCIIPNALDYDVFGQEMLGKTEAQEALGMAQVKVLNAAVISRLSREKEVGMVVEAIAAMSESEKINLFLIGDGEERGKIEKQIQNQGLGERVHLLGSMKDAWKNIRAFDVIVMPAKVEGFGMVTLEAIAGQVAMLIRDNDVFRWLYGNSGVYFNSAASLGEQLDRLVSGNLDLEQLQIKQKKEVGLISNMGIFRDGYLALLESPGT